MQETKKCQNCTNNFVIEPDDFAFYEKMGVPVPVECPDCRLQRRLTFINARSLYRRTCDLCDTSTLSIFRPELDMVVYCQKCYWGDDWDPNEIYSEYNPDVPFLQQLHELRLRTPHAALESLYSSMVNSDYCNYAAYMKNSYLCYFCDYGENVLYTYMMAHVKDSADCSRINECELCYELVGGYKCYQTFYSLDCSECSNVLFSRDCVGCTDCIGCVNLRKKSYNLFNKQYSKDEYQQKKSEMQLDTYDGIMRLHKEVAVFWQNHPVKYMHRDSMSANVSGDYVYQSKNAKQCYMATNLENAKYVQMMTIPKVEDAYDYTAWGANASLIYESTTVGDNAQNVICCDECWPNVNDIQYCIYTHSSHDCFGCVNVRNNEYSILNKKYTKEEYNELKKQIISDMDTLPYIDGNNTEWRYGHGLPRSLSLFGYNEAESGLYIPLEKDEALHKGFAWCDKKDPQFNITIKATDLPNSIKDVEDTILDDIVECEETGRPYRIVRDELVLLRRFGLPLPRKHPDVRLKNRSHLINSPMFYNRTTADGVDVLTSYAPDRPETILSEEGYQDEVM